MEERASIHLFRVLIDPRGFMRAILSQERRSFLFLAMIVGATWILEQALSFSFGYHMDIWQIIVSVIVLSIPAGYFVFYVMGFFLYWTGKILKGQGKFYEIYQAFAYSRVPELFVLMTWVGLIGLIGQAAFTDMVFSTVYPSVVTILLAVQMVFMVWQFVLLLHTLGEVQKFSAWMSIWNVLFTWAVLAIIYQCIAYVLATVFKINALACDYSIFKRVLT